MNFCIQSHLSTIQKAMTKKNPYLDVSSLGKGLGLQWFFSQNSLSQVLGNLLIKIQHKAGTRILQVPHDPSWQ